MSGLVLSRLTTDFPVPRDLSRDLIVDRVHRLEGFRSAAVIWSKPDQVSGCLGVDVEYHTSLMPAFVHVCLIDAYCIDLEDSLCVWTPHAMQRSLRACQNLTGSTVQDNRAFLPRVAAYVGDSFGGGDWSRYACLSVHRMVSLPLPGSSLSKRISLRARSSGKHRYGVIARA